MAWPRLCQIPDESHETVCRDTDTDTKVTAHIDLYFSTDKLKTDQNYLQLHHIKGAVYTEFFIYLLTFEPPGGKTNNVVFEQVQHKLGCTSTEAG